MRRPEVSRLIVAAVATICLGSLPVLISARECGSIEVRNEECNLNQLDGCTVIRGHLLIKYLPRNMSISDFNKMVFPDLREITDYLMLVDVKELISFTKLLPNLTVIRGRRLFLNYALALSSLANLQEFELKSLIAIQRGHIYIGGCPKLCFLKKANWDRLTLSIGKNHIIPNAAATCPSIDCSSCASEFCWSKSACQKFENDNLHNFQRGTGQCHTECLGGCYNSTNSGCVVCRGITDHGVCVAECRNDTFYSEHYQRCFTKEECFEFRLYILGNVCNRRCPPGYESSRKEVSCLKCVNESCTTGSCDPADGHTTFVIYTLGDTDFIKGCHSLNGSLHIELRDKVNVRDLVMAFQNVVEVQGYIKIVWSPYLTSLSFLQNLKKIHGNPAENDTFALVIYENVNLVELWSTPTEVTSGGIFVYGNNKLCNKVTQAFAKRIIHELDKDMIEINDQEVLCDPAKLYLSYMPATQNSIVIEWSWSQTAEETEVLYREAKYSTGKESELDDHVCVRINWKRDIFFKDDLEHNETHVSYNITGLKSFTQYEVLVKTFQQKDGYSARSLIQRFSTAADYPTSPKLQTLSTTENTIVLKWIPRNELNESVSYYLLETFEQAIDRQMLDSRNFCEHPAMLFGVSRFEDFDDCCQRTQQDIEDEQFRRSMEDLYLCLYASSHNCHRIITPALNITNNVRWKNFTVENLKHSTLYTFYLYACNAIGCGKHYIYSERTNYSSVADDLDHVDACRMDKTNTFHVRFTEPINPNGAVVSYSIHFQKKLNQNSDDYLSKIECVTRKQHELSGFEYASTFNDTFDEIAVRTTSLVGSQLGKWFKIGSCSNLDTGIGAFGVFLICSVICAAIVLISISIRRQWWQSIRINTWRRYMAGAEPLDDRQVLVASFDNVAFRNISDE